MATSNSEVNDYIDVTLSNNDTLRDKIHDIHNFLRNSGVGYGMTALKIFNLFYGLKKIELNGNFKKSGLDECCKFSNILKEFNNNTELGNENIKNNILKAISNNKKLKYMLFYLLPNSINAEVLKELINLIEELCNMEDKLNVQLSGKIYEYFIGRDETAISELGAYFTDRHITRYIYETLLKPKLDTENNVYSMIDMFGGSGGFTVGYIDYLMKNYNEIEWNTEIKKINHFDMNEDVIKSAMLEFYCLTGEFSDKDSMKCVNSFQYDFNNKKYHYIITNPPYGGDKNKKSEYVLNLELIKKEIETEFKTKYKVRNMKEVLKLKNKLSESEIKTNKQYNLICQKLKQIENDKNDKNVNLGTSHDIYKEYAEKYGLNGNDKEAVSLIMMMVLLENNGTAIGVLKEGIFFDKKYSSLRKCLVNNFNVKTIVSIPADQFENTATKTSIIVFENTVKKTSKIEFYNLIIKKDSKTTVIKNENGIYKIGSIKDKITNVYHEKVSCGNLDDIISNKYSFNSKDYNNKEIQCNNNYKIVKLDEICNFLSKSKRNASFGSSLGKYNFYTSSDNIKKCDVADYKEECIIIGTGGNSCIHYNKDKFSCSGDTLLIQFENINTKYMYFTLLSNWDILKENMHGTTIKHVTKEMLSKFKVPILKSNDKVKFWVDKISKPYDKKIMNINNIKELETFIQNKIDYFYNKEDCDEVEFNDICEYIKTGKNKTPDDKNGTKYPYYGTSDITGYTDYFLFSGKHILIARNGTMGNCFIVDGKIYPSDHIFVIKNKENININFMYYLVKKISNKIDEESCGSTIKGISKEKLSKIKVKIPKNKTLINDLESIFEKIDDLKIDVKLCEEQYNKYIRELYEDALIKSQENIIDESDDEIIKEIKSIDNEREVKKSKSKKNKIKKLKTMSTEI